ncbi:protein-lysine N-methyltransferase EEF2KMT-like [Glandiceps talaboti]
MALEMEANKLEEMIVSQFFSMVLLRNFEWKNQETDEEWSPGMDDQQRIIAMTTNSELCKQCPPSRMYQKKFLKTLMQKCEDSGVDVCEEIFEKYAELISTSEEEDKCYKTYFLPNGKTVSMEETVQLISHGTTGLHTWPASLYMAEWIVDNTHIFHNKKVLELGSGCGMLGITLYKSCQIKNIDLSDFHGHVLKSLVDNVKINTQTNNEGGASSLVCETAESGSESDCCTLTEDSVCTTNMTTTHDLVEQTTMPEGSTGETEHNDTRQTDSKDNKKDQTVSDLCDKDSVNTSLSIHLHGDNCGNGDIGYIYRSDCVCVRCLDWVNVTTEELNSIQPDIVIAADVVFDPSIMAHLVRVLDDLLSQHNDPEYPTIAYIASTVRSHDTFTLFLDELAGSDITVEDMEGPKQQIFHYDTSCPIKLLKLSKQ